MGQITIKNINADTKKSLYFLIDLSFQEINKLFMLQFENNSDQLGQ